MLCILYPSLNPNIELRGATDFIHQSIHIVVFIAAASCIFLLGLIAIVSSVWQRQISAGSLL